MVTWNVVWAAANQSSRSFHWVLREAAIGSRFDQSEPLSANLREAEFATLERRYHCPFAFRKSSEICTITLFGFGGINNC